MYDAAATSGSPIQIVLLVDASGSMLGDGKIQATNAAIDELIPHLNMLADGHGIQLDVVAFADGADHVDSAQLPSVGRRMRAVEVVPGGLSEVGAAIRGALTILAPSATRHIVVLVSDGRPTDTQEPTFERALAELADLGDPHGPPMVRAALAIGRDADLAELQRFAPDHAVATDAMEMLGKLRELVMSALGDR